jgi:hypothetical protein
VGDGLGEKGGGGRARQYASWHMLANIRRSKGKASKAKKQKSKINLLLLSHQNHHLPSVDIRSNPYCTVPIPLPVSLLLDRTHSFTPRARAKIAGSLRSPPLLPRQGPALCIAVFVVGTCCVCVRVIENR